MTKVLNNKEKAIVIEDLIKFIEKHGEFKIMETFKHYLVFSEKGDFRGLWPDKKDAEAIKYLLDHLPYLLSELKNYYQSSQDQDDKK